MNSFQINYITIRMASNNNNTKSEINSDSTMEKSSPEVIKETTATACNNNAVEDNNTEIDENYVIVDIGANLNNKKFIRDLDSVVARAQDAGKCN